MTFAEKFATIKKSFDKFNTESLPTDLAIQVNMTDDNCGGVFYIANIGGNFAVEPYDYHDHTAMLTASADVLTKIVSEKLDGTDAFFRGLLQVEGNLDHILAVANLKKKSVRNAAGTSAKKTAEKIPAKRTEKKATANKAHEKTAVKKVSEKQPAKTAKENPPVKTALNKRKPAEKKPKIKK